ncbi:MAG: hypothetical protein CVT66_10710 [Actinobacteria bacterium HGW-Actinobacteria-6]|nr:MAG: hypothetical protein CVT66_10710 [Actinobacteria bacterium HGW-Actinobacteria-6]
MIESTSRQTSDESLGMRVFEVSKQRAVERCLARWRNGLRADWTLLSHDDVENLRWIAGEIWAANSREEWDKLHFSKIDLHHTRLIVSHADRLRRHHVNRVQTLDAVVELLHNSRVETYARERGGEDTLPC